MSTYNAIRYNNPYANAGSLILLSTQTASASASIEFTSGIDSTYKEYMFIWNNCHPSVDGTFLSFDGSTDGGSNYGVTKTTTYFQAYHNEADNDTFLGYDTGRDRAQVTTAQLLSGDIGNDNDQSCSGYLHLFNPSSTTYVKHFISVDSTTQLSDYYMNNYVAGYFNTTSAINAVKFNMLGSGNIDAGTIQMFGVVS